MSQSVYEINKSPRIQNLVDQLFEKLPEIESDRAVLLTESYKETEGQPIIVRRAKAFSHILKNIPVTIRKNELIVGSATKSPRSCQVFPEFSYDWLEKEFDTVETRSADPFYISEDNKRILRDVYKYWKGKTTSELATSYMADETIKAMEHNIFTPGNYYYNGVGHVTVKYEKVLEVGYEGIIEEVKKELSKCNVADDDYAKKSHFLKSVIQSCEAVIIYANRYAELALNMAKQCNDNVRRNELLEIAYNCARVPAKGARSFYEACQSFWFVQMLLQLESSGHSISPGRFDQYMYPYYKSDIESGKITKEFAQELMDCIWVKLNDLNKVRDAGSAEGFAGYGLFQNLIVGGQDAGGIDVTNDLSFMAIEASMHVMLPQPSLSIRVWNGSPHELLIKAAKLTRTGIGLPAYYNDEVIIPSLLNRGLTLSDAREYNIIGCVEPQKAGKTDGWHDAAFFNMCRPLELVFSNGYDKGELVGLETGDVTKMKTFEEFYDAYKKQMNYCIELLVNADNSIDVAHMERCPLPYLSSMVDDCIKRGKSVQEGGAIYNFTGPQGFGVANMADSLYAIKKLVFDEKKVTLAEYKDALENNYGRGLSLERVEELTREVIKKLENDGHTVDAEVVAQVSATIALDSLDNYKKSKYDKLLEMIDEVPKFGNDIKEVDQFARDVAYVYTRPLENYKNPRGGQYQAGLYPVSANVPLGAQTGATPDGRLAHTPVADGVSPSAGKDVFGPTAAANSVAKLDHGIASNGTLFNQKFHPSVLAGRTGLEAFVNFIRGYFDQKGSHIQFNVVSRETLIEAQKNPEKYKTLVVRVAGYSALFTSLSRSLQDDIINRTEQRGF
ncbi:4-hydroxyphenylacetate decarboxylase large subunit [uncultured Clostridium sp.]|uniref:glycyl radical protein n=1 Tax=uncultured Clostridium sp. TaxID=59620 RepID=UPI0008226E45|nr:glycyl radical protein [uncultured Clostridium sp.]SCJ90029.1 4-hydroxyphenylacetate decarboxylase large subunit [uncultured Clostridium sp.]